MKTQKIHPTELIVVSDRPIFLADARKAVEDAEGLRVHPLDGSPRPTSLNLCLGILDGQPASILLIDAATDPTNSLMLVQEIFDRRPSPRVLVAGSATDPDLILRSLRAGAGEFLPLPLNRKHLLDAIQRLWRRQAPGTETTARMRGRIYPFLGAKGGCGTTTVATNIAVTLARQGHSTLLVDLDTFGGDVALLLNLKPRFTLVDVVQNVHRLDRELLNGMILKHDTGLEVLPAGDNPERTAAVEASKVSQILNFLRDQFDCVVVNTRDASDPLALAAVNHAEMVHLVACLDLLYLRRAQWSLGRMTQLGLSKDLLRLVINRHEKNPHITLEDAQKILDLKVSWTIPEDPRTVQDALNEGVPFAARNRNGLYSHFDAYAGRLVVPEGPVSPPVPQKKRFGLFSTGGVRTRSEGGAQA